MSRLISWAGAGVAVWWVLHHVALVVAGAWRLAWRCVGTLFAWNQPYSGCYLRMAVDWILVIWVVSLLLPKEKGSRLRQRLWETLAWTVRAAAMLIRWCAAAVFRLVEGAAESGRKPRRKH